MVIHNKTKATENTWKEENCHKYTIKGFLQF
jgi:hypothetical protein